MFDFHLPITEHSDFGFCSIADSFKEAADKLYENHRNKRWLNFNLPTCFLYRHSIELYFKSCIINILKYLRKHTDNSSISDIQIGSTKRPLTSVHSLKLLLDFFADLVKRNKKTIEIGKRTKWSKIPDDLPKWINIIDKFDSNGTYFRYPLFKRSELETAKSSFKEVSPETLSPENINQYLSATLLQDEKRNNLKAYIYDDTALSECLESLHKTADLLSGACAGIKAELIYGKTLPKY